MRFRRTPNCNKLICFIYKLVYSTHNKTPTFQSTYVVNTCSHYSMRQTIIVWFCSCAHKLYTSNIYLRVRANRQSNNENIFPCNLRVIWTIDACWICNFLLISDRTICDFITNSIETWFVFLDECSFSYQIDAININFKEETFDQFI